MSHRTKAAFAAAVAVLAVPASASAATKAVVMGTPPTKQKAFEKLFVDVNDFFPNGTTIHVGDSVQFMPVGFHNVDLPAQGRRGGSRCSLPTGSRSRASTTRPAPRSGSTGQPQVGFNPAARQSIFGKTLTYNGTKARQLRAAAGGASRSR